MKTIALRGKTNSGKTTILKSFAMDLCKNNKNVIWFHRREITAREFWITNWFYNKGGVRDIKVVVKYKNKIVGLVSVGDSLAMIERAYNCVKSNAEKKGYHLDLFICACHKKTEIDLWLKSISDSVEYIDIESITDKIKEKI